MIHSGAVVGAGLPQVSAGLDHWLCKSTVRIKFPSCLFLNLFFLCSSRASL